MMKLLFYYLPVLILMGCKSKTVYGKYESMNSSLGSLDYTVQMNENGTFEQYFGDLQSNKGEWRKVSDVGYELKGWVDYLNDDDKNTVLTIYIDIVNEEIIIVNGFNEYNFEKTMFD